MKPPVMERVRELGDRLEAGLNARLADKWYVGNIRGMGLFWAIEFVSNKQTKEPFLPTSLIASGVYRLAMQEPHMISLYPCTGCVEGVRGDFVLLAPPYTSTDAEIDLIVDRTAGVVEAFFNQEAIQKLRT